MIRSQNRTEIARSDVLKMFLILTLGLILSPLTSGELYERPFLQEILVPKNLKENQTFRLLCALTQGESVDFQWFHNDKKLESTNRRKIVFKDDSSELIIKSLSVDDLGEINCIAKNKYGQDVQKVQLLINGWFNLFF